MITRIFIAKTITVFGLPDNVLMPLSSKLTFQNPEFQDKTRRGLSTKGVPERIYLYSYMKEHNLIEIPKGAYDLLLKILDSNDVLYETTQYSTGSFVDFPPHKIQLRDYQVEPIKEVLRHFETTPSLILRSEAGSGKTTMSLYIAHKMGLKTLWLTDKDNLFQQTKNRIMEFLNIPEEKIGQIVGPKWEIGDQVTIGMIPTLANRDLTEIAETFGLLIVDECVLVPTKRCFKVLSSFAADRVLGITAFAERGDGLTEAIFAIIGNVKVDVPSAGVIYPLVIKRRTGRAFAFNPSVHRKLPHLFDKKIANDTKRNEMIIQDIGLYGDKFVTVVLSKTVAHLETLKSGVDKAYSLRTTITHSNSKKLSPKERKVNEEAFLNGEHDVIFATYGMLATGYDYPRLDRIIWAMPYSSKDWAYQSSGRVSRIYPGKKGALVIDYIDNSEKLIYQSEIRDSVCRDKGLRIVERKEKDYLTDEDKIMFFSTDDR
jgi:superfamily II DNA or RNA helicase